MPDPTSDPSIQFRRPRPRLPSNGNGSPQGANGAAHDDVAMTPEPRRPGSSTMLSAFVGTFGALLAFALIAGLAWLGYAELKSSLGSAGVKDSATNPVSASMNKSSSAAGFNDPSKWVAGTVAAQTVASDTTPDIGWWTRTFDLPKQDKIAGYLTAEGLDATRVVPVHYEDSPQATTITYHVEGTVPDELLRVPKATWAPSDPELRPFAAVVVLNHDLPAGQFWNTTEQSVAQPAGAKVDIAWKVQLDKSTHTVTADELPFADGAATPQQVAQFEMETNDTVNAIKAQVAAIDARVQADAQAKIAQVPPNPPKPELMSTHWNHGDGSGEPTRSAERMGGGTVAGAAGGAAIGAAAGDAGMGAGIGAGAGLLGGFIYDTVSKNNDRHRYERHAEAENAERMDQWRGQVRALARQRDQIKKDATTERNREIQDLVARLAAAGGHMDALPAPADTPQPMLAPSETTVTPVPAQVPASGPPPADSSPDQPSGPVR